MESDIIHLIKEVFCIIIGPLIGLFAWIGKRLHNRVDNLESKINILDKDSAIHQTQLTDIKEDIHNLDKKLDKILDKVRK